MGLAFAVIAAIYVALAVATITVTSGAGSKVPLADLIAVGFGRAGRDATAVLAVALTMGTMNVYTAARRGSPPRRLVRVRCPDGSAKGHRGACRAAPCSCSAFWARDCCSPWPPVSAPPPI